MMKLWLSRPRFDREYGSTDRSQLSYIAPQRNRLAAKEKGWLDDRQQFLNEKKDLRKEKENLQAKLTEKHAQMKDREAQVVHLQDVIENLKATRAEEEKKKIEEAKAHARKELWDEIQRTTSAKMKP